jgi:hypothetical protein
MGPLRIKAIVPKDHRVEIAVPPDVPEGPVEIEMTFTPEPGDAGNGKPDWDEVLDRLRELRESLAGRDIRLSDEVIKLRQEEG